MIQKLYFFVMTDIPHLYFSSDEEIPAPKPRLEVLEPYTFEENNEIKIGINLTFSQTGNFAQFMHKLLCIEKHQTLIKYKHNVFLFALCLNF